MNKPSLKDLVEDEKRREELLKQPRYLTKQERELMKGSTVNDIQKPIRIRDNNMNMVVPKTQMEQPKGPTEKRIKFDWDPTEDTLGNDDLLYFNYKIQKPKHLMPQDKHWKEKRLEEMTERDWRIFREDYNISCSGLHHNQIHPLRNWWESQLLPLRLHEQIADKYPHPSPIQRQVIPLACAGRDVIGLAETGSGKTLSFLVPCISSILKGANGDVSVDGPYAVIIVPTRELAQQIEQAAQFLLNCSISKKVRTAVLVGGHCVEDQAFSMRNGVELVIGTPGRLRDFLERHLLVFNQCRHLILDEADRIIDMNFEEDLMFILQHFQGRPQTLLFSATMPVAVERIAKGYLDKPITVTIGSVGGAVDSVEQRIQMVQSENDKINKLSAVLEAFKPPVIIFVNQKRTVDFLVNRLDVQGWRVIGYHGGRTQTQREAAVLEMRSGHKDVLVATDVAGRGLDIPGVSLVVNYDMAKSIEEYIHRIGRTGRAGLLGCSVTFLSDDDKDLFYDLKQCISKSVRSSQLPMEFTQHEATRMKPGHPKRRQDETITAFGV